MKKAPSFPVVSSSRKDPSGRYQITYILVHGLQGLISPNGVFYEHLLQSWLSEFAGRNGRGRYNHIAYVFPFQLLALMSGGETEFGRLRQKLYAKIEIQPWSSWRAVAETPGQPVTAVGSEDTRGVVPLDLPPPSIIFLCHGVGTWLVKDMLSRDCGNFVAVNTLSVIPLDTLEVDHHQPAGQLYSPSIKEHLQAFHLTGPEKGNHCDTLSKLLERVDIRFDKLGEYMQEVPGLHKLPEWVAEPIRLWTLNLTHLTATTAFQSPSENEQTGPRWPIIRSSTIKPELPAQKATVKQKLSARAARIFGMVKGFPNQAVLEGNLEALLGKLEHARCTPGTAAPENRPGLDIATRAAKPLAIEIPSFERDRINAGPSTGDPSQQLIRSRNNPNALLPVRGSTFRPHAKTFSNVNPWPSSGPDTTHSPDLDDLKKEVQEQRLNLLKGLYKLSPEAINRIQNLKRHFERRTLSGEVSDEALTELARLHAQWLTVAHGDYWKAWAELVKAPSLHSAYLKRNDMDPIALRVNSAGTLGDLALTFAYLGYFTRASTLITGLLRSIDLKLNGIRTYESRQDPGRTTDEAILTQTQLVKSSLMNKRYSVAQIAAEILRAAGDYRGALKMAQGAWQGFSNHLGAEDVKTLESQVLRADLLALNSVTPEAETSCYQAWQSLSVKQGPLHPRTLEALRTLVFIFRMQYRLVEAEDTARSLCRLTEEATSITHPHALSARAEFARSLLLKGHFKASESEYCKIIDISRRLYSFHSKHPDTLLYQSELARVYMHLGLLDKAESLAMAVLNSQHHAYQYEWSKAKEGQVDVTLETPPLDVASFESHDIPLRTVMDDLMFELAVDISLTGVFKHGQDLPERPRASLQQLQVRSSKVDQFKFVSRLRFHCSDAMQKARLDNTETQNGLAMIQLDIETGRAIPNEGLEERLKILFSRLRVHPYLLQTIHILVEILIQKGASNHADTLACELAELVLKWRTRTLGEVHDSTLSAKYTLALAVGKLGDVDKARELLVQLYHHHDLYFERNHPETLQVKRELIITSVAANRWQDPDTITSTTNEDDDDFGELVNDETSPNSRSPPPPPLSSGGNTVAARPMSQNDWGAVERHSVFTALAQEGRMGLYHPETLQTYFWILALQLMVGKIIEASATSRLLVGRLCHKEVLRERPFIALEMMGKAASLSLEANLVADALDIYDEIVNRAKGLLADGSVPNLAGDERDQLNALVRQCHDTINDVLYTDKVKETLERMGEMYRLLSANEGEARDVDILIVNGLRFGSRARLSADEHELLSRFRALAKRRYRLLVESLREHSRDGDMSAKKWEEGRNILDNAFKLLQSTLVENLDALEVSKRLHADLQKTLQDEGWRRKSMAMDTDDLVNEKEVTEHVNGVKTPGGCQDDTESATDTILRRIVEQCLELYWGLEGTVGDE